LRDAAMGYVYQALIFFVVMASNFLWHWTANDYVAALVAGVVSLVAILVISNAISRESE
jgi:hypothetical protein